jgi:hypothetical protein
MRQLLRAPIGLTLGLALLLPAVASAQTVEVQPAPAPAPVVVQQTPPPAPATVVVPPAQQTVTETDTGPNPLLLSGLVGFGASYGAAVIVAASSDHQGDNRLYVPVLGPWLDIGDRGSCPVSNSKCDNETTNKVLLVADGVIQGASALAIVGGILSPGTTATQTTVSQAGVHFTPVSYGPASPGLAAFGSF